MAQADRNPHIGPKPCTLNYFLCPAHWLTGKEAEGGHPALDGQLMVGIGTACPHVPEPQLPVPVPADNHVATEGRGVVKRKR